MSDANAKDLNQAADRLYTAVKTMEEAVAERRHKELVVGALEEQVQALGADLESERQRGQELAATNEQVSQRIDALIESIEDILQRG